MSLGTLLIRADAGPKIGTGHVMRCLALAQAWQDTGGDVVFVMAESTPSVLARLRTENCSCVTISAQPGTREDAELTNRYAEQNAAEWIVIDGYDLAGGFQERLKCGNRKLLCIDDEGLLERYFADVVLNQNITAGQTPYRKRAPQARLLLGPKFCLLRREFAQRQHWRREIPMTARKVLVTLGGSTPEEIGIRVMESLDLVNIDGLHATFVIGGSSPALSALERRAAQTFDKVLVVKDALNMAALMSEADAAISAAGSTCWELCLLGLPSILIDLASNQTPVAMELHRSGCAIYAGRGNNVEPAGLAQTLQALLRSQEMRESLSSRSRELVDGRGAERVVSAMRSFEQEPTSLLAEAVGD